MEKYQLTKKQFEKLTGKELPVTYVASVADVPGWKPGTPRRFEGEIFSGEGQERVAKLEMEVNRFGRENYTITVEVKDNLLMDGLKAVDAKKLPALGIAKREGPKKLTRR